MKSFCTICASSAAWFKTNETEVPSFQEMYWLCTGQMHLLAFVTCDNNSVCFLVVCFCTESLPRSTANVQPAAEFVFLLLINSRRWGGIWGETAVYHCCTWRSLTNTVAFIMVLHVFRINESTSKLSGFLQMTKCLCEQLETLSHERKQIIHPEHCDQDMILLMAFSCECHFFLMQYLLSFTFSLPTWFFHWVLDRVHIFLLGVTDSKFYPTHQYW